MAWPYGMHEQESSQLLELPNWRKQERKQEDSNTHVLLGKATHSNSYGGAFRQTHALRLHHLVPACALHGHVQRHAANACSCPLHARWVIRLYMSATTTACKEYLSSQSIVTVTSEATASRATPSGSPRLHPHHSIALTMRGWHAQK